MRNIRVGSHASTNGSNQGKLDTGGGVRAGMEAFSIVRQQEGLAVAKDDDPNLGFYIGLQLKGFSDINSLLISFSQETFMQTGISLVT